MFTIIVTKSEAVCRETLLRSLGFKQNTAFGDWILKNITKEHCDKTKKFLSQFMINCLVRS